MSPKRKLAAWQRFAIAGAALLVGVALLAAMFGSDVALAVARKHGKVLGNDRIGYSVQLTTRKGVNEVLPLLGRIPKLVELKIMVVPLTPEDIRLIGGLTSLEKLWLIDCGLQGEELDPLSNLTNLVRIYFYKNPSFTDRGMRFLKSLERLELLNLTGTAVRGDGIRNLSELPHLKELALTETQITDQNLPYCTALEHLEILSIESPNVTTAGLMQLVNMHSLRSLGTPNSVTRAEKKRLGQAFASARRAAIESGVVVPSQTLPIDAFD